MSVSDELLQDVRDQPDDNGLRLVFADWLEDAGHSDRAEFVRTQIERARLPLQDDRHADLEARERRLLLAHAEEWVPAELPLGWTRFRRGLPEVLAAPPPWLTDEQIESLGPMPLRELRLKGGYGEFDAGRLRELDLLGRVETLQLGGAVTPLDGTEVCELLGAEGLTRLRRLALEHNGLGEQQVNRLLDLPAVGNVETLYLEDDGVTDAALRKLLQRPWPNLRWLALRFNELSLAGFESFVRSELWRRLDAIALEWQHTGPVEAAHVEAIEGMQARSLSLEDRPGSSFLPTLCAAARWGRLERLVLWRSRFAPGVFERFLEHPALGGIRELYLADCGLGPTAVSQLARCPHLTNLALLWLDGWPALGDLAGSDSVCRLNYLSAGGSEAEVIAFVNSPNASHVRWLRVPIFTDLVAAAVADSPHLGRLTTLSSGGALSDDAAERLAASPHLKSLTCLKVNADRLTGRGVKALLEAEHLGWVGVARDQVKGVKVRRLWERRYGDGERVELIDDDWPEWRHSYSQRGERR